MRAVPRVRRRADDGRAAYQRTRALQLRDLALAALGARSSNDVSIQRVITKHISRVLAATDDNLSLAAELLGVNRRTLQRYRRMRKRRMHYSRRAR